MPDLLYQKFPDKHHAVFTMNRPAQLNALNINMIREQAEALEDFTADPEMRVGILTGNGRAFSAGADLKEMAERNAQTAEIEAKFAKKHLTLEQRNEALAKFKPVRGMVSFSNGPKPVIAAINGLCLAGGMERAIDCDIRICSTEAYFGLFEVKRGILAGYAIQHVARVMPFGEALYLLTTGDTLKAQDAHRVGFVHEVVEPARLMPRAVEIAEMIAANAPLAVQGSKAMAIFWRKHGMEESERLFQWIYKSVLSSEDAKEGPRAFAEKRPPVWKAR
ncbi:MAG: enoyl-CoA hydratase/isomerase family protein [Chloroflexi bacterium]|nr:enoyl-CoA hydratase/isomerase family protein [Chloroflexota bacterium]